MNWELKTGNFLFKYRSFTPVPLIVAVFLFFKPVILPGADTLLTISGIVVMAAGEILRIISVGYSFSGTSGRENFLRADHLNVSGIYSVVRNPLYIGNIMIYTGLLLTYSNIYALLFFDAMLIAQYYFIILAEEDYLERTYGNEYTVYKNKVRSIIPVPGGYRKPVNRFNGVKVIFKENDSVFNALIILIMITQYKQSITSGTFRLTAVSVGFVSVLVILYIVIKTVKSKHRGRTGTEWTR